MVDIKKAFKKAGNGIANAGKTAGKGVATGGKTAGKGVANAGKTAGKGVANAGKSAGSFAKNKVLGPIVKFFKALWKYLVSCICLCCVLVLWQTGILSMGWAAITGVAGGMSAVAAAASPSPSNTTSNSVADSMDYTNSQTSQRRSS